MDTLFDGVADVVVSQRFERLGADGAPRRLGIMGGTFDPVHVGHVACADEVRRICRLDAVLLVPAGVSVFKKGRDVALAAHRLNMCRLAVAAHSGLDVSAIEVNRPGDSYTADTLRQLRAHYPKNVELFFIVGADAAATLGSWHEPEAIARAARIIAMTRPGHIVAPECRASLAVQGFSVDYVRVADYPVSSSAIREKLAKGESVRDLLAPNVYDYVSAHGLYRCAGEWKAKQCGKGGAVRG
ncbi:nicotinate-nucleotide adenylyltransferase [Adlercreutzia sp. ZJ138]|uniref:nicotinate-nucleotide adenylyltransferase n=1 Tax=Adlercreutzia sp. ZJ138 TaxID=2709405 RepID=UPI001F14F970|nr:nicotinate-nucleotide adenylyltransferase [Adlercreutzia sp. ZJ138]